MHDDGYFDATIAATYDDPLDPMNQPAAIEPAVAFLSSLAGGGRVLEFAIGTGRIGLPMSRRGVEVHGIELSQAMLEHLRRKDRSWQSALCQDARCFDADAVAAAPG